AQVLRGERLSESRVLELAIDAAGALGQAHRAGLVHRDVKPDNLMIGDDGRVRLIDFGLAGRSGVRAENVAVGTFTYSAPEQTGVLHRPVDARADLYALGVVLYECLAGEPPFAAADAGELIWLHLSATPAELNTVRPDVSPPLAAMVATLLAKDPDDRYQSADALRVSLERIRDGGDPALPPRPVDVPDDAFLFPLVGREAELAGLRARWARARAGAGGAALVHGDTGCGKSRLVQELTADVAASGHPVLYGKCDPDQVTPLAVLRGVLEQYVEAVTRRAEPARAVAMAQLRTAAGETASVLGALSPKLTDLLAAPRLPDGDHERQVVEAVAALLVGLADEAGGAVLHLDDVQWCDDGSRVVLRRLAVLLPESRLLVVATGGDDGAAAAAVESFGTDLGPAVDVRLGLGPLTEGAIAALVAGQLGPSAAPPALVARLASRSGGNPMAVLEYTRAVIDAGLLRPSWGTWLLDEPGLADLALPDDVLDLVLRRIDTVGAAAREVLTVAATVGGRFTADLVAAVTAGEPQAVHAALTEVAGHRLIEATSGGRYLFPHDGIREALLADVDPDRLRRLHRRVAEELECLGDA
ncbi:MAG TPA: AAA family ATPase, partial [Pilimelia sp.]|nr:AAA family ATPase [Pilimelia sp.]